MKIINIYYSSHFAKAFKKLPASIKAKTIYKENIFRNNCFDISLKTHKLHGALNNYWSFSVSESHRILFEFSDKNTVGFIDIGTHSIYKKHI
ncbi:type II toxin-antitoxin system mRNA interferase toxin, RelE/StbE family [Candidatus Peregrinibacteria bacterium]|nr:type II toxin-antitoxin system mRNA interferase toxin, RelE/StbE family [Candidatus Peregrinibacteria bacterium]